MADREIRLIGSFKDDITPKLKKLNKEITATVQQFSKLQSKLRPIARDMGVIAMASDRLSGSLKAQRGGFETNIRAMQQYRNEMGKVARAQRSMKPAVLPAPRMPRATGGGGGVGPRGRGGGGGTGIGEIAIGSALGGVITNAVVAGFQQGVALMVKPFEMFGRAFAERIGDEMQDIKSAGGMFALDKKSKTPLFKDFEDAMKMQEGLNRSLAKSAAALPGATGDYVKAARGLTDTVMGAFTKNEEAFKKFATELGAREGATSEEAITKVLQRFTEQTVLLGQGQAGGMPLTMLMEQLVTKEAVNIQGMAARYAQLRSNPLLANMLKDAEAEINKTTAGTAERFRAVMKALDAALPQEVVNKMRRSVAGLIEATRSAFIDPDTGLFGLSRELNVMVPKVNQFGQYVNAQGKVVATASQAVQETTSLFKIMKETLANFAVPILELLGTLPQIFDPFKLIAEQFKELRETSNLFYRNFNSYTKWFENQSSNFMKQAEKLTDPKAASQMKRQANLLKEQAGARGALATINNAMRAFGVIDYTEFQKNAAKLEDTSLKGIEAFGKDGMANMAKRLLTQFVNSPIVEQIAETLGQALGAFVDTIFTMIDGLLSGVESKTGNKLIDAFSRGFSKIITPERANQIAEILDRLLTKLFNMAADIIINKVIPAIGVGILKAIEAAWNAGPLGKFLVVVGALVTFQKAVIAATAAMETMAALKGLAGLVPGMGRGRTRGRPQVLARKAGRQTVGALGGMAAAVPGLGKAGAKARALGNAAKMKGVGILAAGAVKMATVSPELAKVGKSMGAIGKRIPGLNVAFAALDFTLKKMEGKDTLQAASEAGGGLAGGIIGGAIGTAILPGVGTAIGGVLGTMLGDWLGSKLPGMLKGLGSFFTKTIPDWWNKAVKGLTSAISSAWNATAKFFTVTLPNLIASGWDSLVKFIKDLPTNILRGIGVLIGLIQNAWDGLVKFFTVTLPTAWRNAINFTRNALITAWNGLINFFRVTLPNAWRSVITFVVNALKSAWTNLVSFMQSLPARLSQAFSALMSWFASLPGKFRAAITTFTSSASNWASQVTTALGSVGTSIINWAKGLPGRVWAMLTGAAAEVERGRRTVRPDGKPQYAGSGTGALMPIGGAVAAEMRKKPPGSDLVVANSSELIIPTKNAAEGQGTVASLVAPLVSIDAKTSMVASYIVQMRSQLASTIRQTTSAVNNMGNKISAGMPVKVVNQPTVKFSGMGGAIGGGIGKFPKTSGYGMRWGRMHQGNDYGMPVGTKLGIGGPGKILFAGNAGAYGKMVDIGGPGGMVYRFAHLSKINAPVGATLPPGYPFALSGNTGRSTGPHLHFEARPFGGAAVPPDAFSNIIRANFVGSPFGPLMDAVGMESKKMPYGAQLAVSNSDEIFMKPKQMASVIESSTRAGAEGVGNITTGPINISIDGYNQDPKQLTDVIAAELINAMYRKSRSEVLTS